MSDVNQFPSELKNLFSLWAADFQRSNPPQDQQYNHLSAQEGPTTQQHRGPPQPRLSHQPQPPARQPSHPFRTSRAQHHSGIPPSESGIPPSQSGITPSQESEDLETRLHRIEKKMDDEILEGMRSLERFEKWGKEMLKKIAGPTMSRTTPPNSYPSSQQPGQNPTQPRNAYPNSYGQSQAYTQGDFPDYAMDFGGLLPDN